MLGTGGDPRGQLGQDQSCRHGLTLKEQADATGWILAAEDVMGKERNMDPGAIPGWLFRPPIRRTT